LVGVRAFDTLKAMRLCVIFAVFAFLQSCEPGFSPGNADPKAQCFANSQTRSAIKHVVIIIQENHTFDNYFANYCTAAVGSNPSCTSGPACCETGPTQLSGISPLLLDDAQNMAFDPNHLHACELRKINGGLMDGFISGSGLAMCSDARSFAYADQTTMSTYWGYANQYAIADHYFQPAVGASSENDMYFARAQFVFLDDVFVPNAVGSTCYSQGIRATFTGATLGDLLKQCDVPWAFYAEGYQDALKTPLTCTRYPEGYAPSDNPFQYYRAFMDNPLYQKDYAQFATDIETHALPAVSFIKPLGTKSEHPGSANITDGVNFVKQVVESILNSPEYQQNTLILVTYDEGGGFYDHVPPPPASSIDGQEYGTRVPFFALGFFAKTGEVSHVVMEHSSIVRFIEWNFLDGEPGQLGTRDAVVNNIGSLLDPVKTGITVP